MDRWGVPGAFWSSHKTKVLGRIIDKPDPDLIDCDAINLESDVPSPRRHAVVQCKGWAAGEAIDVPQG